MSYNWVISACIIYSHMIDRSRTFSYREHVFYCLNQKIVRYLTRGCLILADLLALMITWRRTFLQLWEARRLKIKSSVAPCFLRDGECCLICMQFSHTETTNILRHMVFHVCSLYAYCLYPNSLIIGLFLL